MNVIYTLTVPSEIGNSGLQICVINVISIYSSVNYAQNGSLINNFYEGDPSTETNSRPHSQ